MNATIERSLKHFTGTENYYGYRLFAGPVIGTYTDGVKFLEDECGAYWLIDAIFSYQYGKIKKEPFQVWTLNKCVYKTGKRAGQEYWKLEGQDGNNNVIAKQIIEFSDFPLDEIKLYLINRVLLLPSEY